MSDSRKHRRVSLFADRTERVLAQVLDDDPAYALKVARVRRYQARLRGRLSAPSWRLYLQLEEAQVGRWTHALELVVRWGVARRRSRQR